MAKISASPLNRAVTPRLCLALYLPRFPLEVLGAERAAALEEAVTAMHGLPACLAPVPLACLDLPARILESLRSVGIERFGDCCRLPGGGVARRTDPHLLAYLDRALGKRPDPRLPYAPPPIFQRRLSLPGEVRDTQTLLIAAHRLLLELAGYLQARAGGVQALEWHLA